MLLATLAVLSVACGDTPDQASTQNSASSEPNTAESPSATTTNVRDSGKPYTGYPDAIVMLGHSGSTGESSDPEQPGVEVRKNSWATGTNPAVNSLYQRVLQRHPGIKDDALSLSQAGATVEAVLGQAQDAVERHPHNALVVIQVIDNDIVCPATSQNFNDFQKSFEAVLSELEQGLPSSRILAVTQLGSPETYAAALTPTQRQSFGGTGPCAFLDTQGKIVPRELDRLEEIIHGYETALERGCAAFQRCAFDDYAFSRVIDKNEYFADDLNHFSVAGHAKAADVAWKTMQDQRLVP